jgi:hypothetical protein
MADTNVYQELKDALSKFKDFMTTNLDIIKTALKAAAAFIPQVPGVIDQLVGLLNTLKAEIDKIDPSKLTGVAQISALTDGVAAILTATKAILPDQSSAIEGVTTALGVLKSVPSLTQIKTDIISLITDVTNLLTQVKP